MTRRALTRRALSLAVLGAAFAMAAGVAAGITALSDEFDSSASLGAWTAMDGDLQGGTSPTHAIEGGELTITPGRSWWVDGVRAFYLHKEVRGDFKATARIKATGTQSALPTANWSLSGLLARRATDNAANENWVAFRSGLVGGRSVLERKTTRASHSDLVLDPIQRGWIELRISPASGRGSSCCAGCRGGAGSCTGRTRGPTSRRACRSVSTRSAATTTRGPTSSRTWTLCGSPPPGSRRS